MDEWYGWKDIKITFELVGDSITKGTGMWEKKYTYIKIPKGYGYDNYCFLLSSKCVHYSSDDDFWWFSICHDMKIELVFDVDLRVEGKRYKRYKLSGRELFNAVFKDYEVNFAKGFEERTAKEQAAKDLRDKSILGQIVCAKYKGNHYSLDDIFYSADSCFKAYFIGNNNITYCNSKFNKIRNVRVEFIVFDNISKYDFLRCETIINAYLNDYDMYKGMLISLEQRLERVNELRHSSRSFIRSHPEWLVVTGLDDIVENSISSCKCSMEEIKIRLRKRIEDLLS